MASVDLETAKSELAEKRSVQIREMEFLTQLLLSSQVSRVQHMRASIALALIKGSLDQAEVAAHFGVSDETVRTRLRKSKKPLKSLAHKCLGWRHLVHNS